MGAEDASVESWRFQQLLDAGYPPALAVQLATAPHVDLHQALTLITRGCTHDIAARILL